MSAPDQFRYDGFVIDPGAGTIDCSYSTPTHSFTESFGFGPDGDWDSPALVAAARLLFFLAGVSYYKTTAAPVIDLGPHPTTAAERAFLYRYYLQGLGEFAYRNGLDLEPLEVVGPDGGPERAAHVQPGSGPPARPLRGRYRLHRHRRRHRPGSSRHRAVRGPPTGTAIRRH